MALQSTNCLYLNQYYLQKRIGESMNLHENKKLFTDAVLAASDLLDILPVYVEKDYWITRTLKLFKMYWVKP